MGHNSHSTNVHVTEIHNKDLTQRNNNVENENNHYKETNKIHNNLYGDKVYGGAVASDGDSNYGTATYKLVNLNDADLDLQNLGLFKDLTGAIGAGAQLGGQIWQAADKDSFDKMGGKIMGGVGAGAKVAGGLDDKFHLGKKTGMDDWGWMNLSQEEELQNLGMFGMVAGLADISSKAGGEIWKNVDRKSYDHEGKKIMNGINQGAKIAEKLPVPFINMEQEEELQNLSMFKDLTEAIGAGAQLGGQIWQAADPKSFNKEGKAIMGGIAAGSDFTGKLDDKFHIGKHTGIDNWDFMNLDQQPTTAIIASPEQAIQLLNLNSQLDQPYEIKGAYLI